MTAGNVRAAPDSDAWHPGSRRAAALAGLALAALMLAVAPAAAQSPAGPIRFEDAGEFPVLERNGLYETTVTLVHTTEGTPCPTPRPVELLFHGPPPVNVRVEPAVIAPEAWTSTEPQETRHAVKLVADTRDGVGYAHVTRSYNLVARGGECGIRTHPYHDATASHVFNVRSAHYPGLELEGGPVELRPGGQAANLSVTVGNAGNAPLNLRVSVGEKHTAGAAAIRESVALHMGQRATIPIVVRAVPGQDTALHLVFQADGYHNVTIGPLSAEIHVLIPAATVATAALEGDAFVPGPPIALLAIALAGAGILRRRR